MKSNNKHVRDNINRIIRHHDEQLKALVGSFGIDDCVQQILDVCSSETTQKWSLIHSSFQSDIVGAEPAAKKAMCKWFHLLPVATQNNPLARYYYEQLTNLVADTAHQIEQYMLAKECQTHADLRQNHEQVRRLNELAGNSCGNVIVYQRLLESQFRTACAHLLGISNSHFHQIEFQVYEAELLALRLMKAAQALEI